ncbi:MAG: ligand-binding sensor domain-containing protein [Neolewinella sp.]|jgi:ligand-binding sensor domain-containing protein
MTFTKFIVLFATTLMLQGFAQAQEWTSYQSPNQINDLLDTGSELLLATDAGLIVVDKSTLERTTFNTNNSSLTNNHIQTITQAPNGNVWVGTYDIVLLPFDGSDFQDPVLPSNEFLNQNTNLYDLKIAPNGDFWIGTTDGVFHREGQTWSHYGEEEFGPAFFESWDIDIKDNGDVLVVGREVHQLVGSEWVNLSEGTAFQGYLDAEIFTSSTGDLYVAGDLDSVFRFDGQDWQGYELDFNGFQLLGFTEDTEGNVYFNSRDDGVYKLENDNWVQQDDAQTTAFGGKTDYFHIDDQNKRWFNRDIHLSLNDDGDISTTLLADHMLRNNFVAYPIKGDNGIMYFSSSRQDNFSVFDTEGNWSTFAYPPLAVNESLSDMIVFADDNVLVCTTLGLHRFDGNAWMFTSLGNCYKMIKDSQGKTYITSDSKVYIIDNGVLSEYNTTNSPVTTIRIGGIGVDANDNLWIASSEFETENVIQTVSSEGEWTTYSAADHPEIIRPDGEFAFDNEGNVWIVDKPFGPLKFDGAEWTKPLREVPNDAITSKSIDDLKVDAAGKLYLAHAYGISTLMDGEWENFINEDVITNNSQDTAIEFDDQGTLWWANGRTGLFSFKPAVISSSSSPFSAAAINFMLYPNPAQTYTTLDFTTRENAKVKVAIYNQLGQLASGLDLGQFPEGTYQQEINIDRLPTGFYTVQVQVNGSSSTRKLIIE